MEPWLDGLSEEWNSEPRSSPPASVSGRNNDSRHASSNSSQSRIPHLAANIRASSNSGFLRPRSTRGLARLKEDNGLTEKTASSLNAAPVLRSSTNGKTSSAIPFRTSTSSHSDSQTSVQHHTVNKAAVEEISEWKRRLQSGDGLNSDGMDLFSPSKLEGIFKQSSCPVEPEDDEDQEAGEEGSVVFKETRPWDSLGGLDFPLPPEHVVSHRSTKRGPSTLDTLQEVEEGNEDSIFCPQIQPSGKHSVSLDSTEEGNMGGIVKRRVSNLNTAERRRLQERNHKSTADPRMRTISGREEISNEGFSQLEDSEKSSIRKQAVHGPLYTDTTDSRDRFDRFSLAMSSKRPSSRSSDHDISYATDDKDQSLLQDDVLAEITSQSLPEDLSMGTQNYQPSILEVVTNRKPSRDRQDSAMPRGLSSDIDTSLLPTKDNFRSSPPPYKSARTEKDETVEDELPSIIEDSVVHHQPTSAPQSTAGSPLKLFGVRDTYTNNKLMRILSHFEEEDSQAELLDLGVAPQGMSKFGKGELDGYDFKKDVERPVVKDKSYKETLTRIFTAVPDPPNSADTQRKTTSPTKERSPKRRRTLLKDEIFVNGTEVEIKVSRAPDGSLAGKKRRDALPGTDAEPASPDTMASRPVLRPLGSRRSSENAHRRTGSVSEVLQTITNPTPVLMEEVAHELQAFTEKAAEVKADSRKASLATKDYMEEANKVMEFIRARGKPKPALSEIQEPDEFSELNPDNLLDLDVDDSTKDSFSRPPSREGQSAPKPDRRHAKHNSLTADHLQRFRDAEDLELLNNTSALGTLHLVDNKAGAEAALVPVPEDEQLDIGESFQSDPPGMRILNDNDRKRKLSDTNVGYQSANSSQNIHSDGSKRTVATVSSTGSRGMISHGTVSIPDTIGVMTFDKENKTWVKQRVRVPQVTVPISSPAVRTGRQDHSEADPFEDIPDLSIDETGEAVWKKAPTHSNDTKTAKTGNMAARLEQKVIQEDDFNPSKVVNAPSKSSMKLPRKQRDNEPEDRPSSKASEVSRHEERLHNGVPSAAISTTPDKRQARVVTIAFTSPIASEIPYTQAPSITESDLDEDDPSMLPLDDEGSVLATVQHDIDIEIEAVHEEYDDPLSLRPVMGSLERHEQYRAMTLKRRPVSRIEEYDEEVDNQELSLIHVKHNNEMTPVPNKQLGIRRDSMKNQSSILSLTPLSEFTLNQVDKLNHPEESFVAERANAKTLRQAHGSHALVEDALVKAITDAEPTELFWEELRRLNIRDSGLVALLGLDRYCSSLELLDAAQNRIVQLADLPRSLLSLNVSRNLINDLTSWTHLRNLQYIDVSENQLESLESFSSLVHLRRLKASKNKIRQIDGVLDLHGLISLDLSGNDLPEVDFDNCELSSLEELNLSDCRLMHVRNVDCLPSLRHLDLTQNLLEEFTVGQHEVVSALEKLSLAENGLSDFDISQFPKLHELNIDSNAITILSGLDIAENLNILSARGQRTKSNLVNNILCSDHDCIELYLSSNALPETGLRLPREPNYTLRCLELSSCGIELLPQGFGDYFPNIRVLNLNFNALSDLSTLQGCSKLRNLFLSRNRIKKMRRTCLTLSRLPALRKLDLRDNPLTVGFYGTLHHITGPANENPYRLPMREAGHDQRWVELMDETTWMRRRAMELLLAQCCTGIEEYDGMRFDVKALLGEQGIWQKLMGRGVLQKEKDLTVVVHEMVSV